ncbi:BTB/POZ domain containing protein [Histomonas meleagridis]|uniref:BTB/POZ domain containing protein n=1 Tax=Histomonas meleagridis TaxID=135588 RepID=UPI0035594DCC|nr:BTB/POZ domain containing protein [Histomonas meleagridis]KAH0804799.1 BTB/POZ domain containing protein [Histomonas meleagridis]
MNFQRDLIFTPLFDFKPFYNDGFLSDCEIRVHDNQYDASYVSIKSHVAILSNSSDFFFNSFTSEMDEQKTGIVHVYDNPSGLLQKVIEWMYNGQISFTDNELMPLIHISKIYGIRTLDAVLSRYLDTHVNPQIILNYASQCFEYELADELKLLELYFVKFFDKITITNFTNSLDVITFTNIIKRVNIDYPKKIKILNEFLGDFKCDKEELAALKTVIPPNNKEAVRAAKKLHPYWYK